MNIYPYIKQTIKEIILYLNYDITNNIYTYKGYTAVIPKKAKGVVKHSDYSLFILIGLK